MEVEKISFVISPADRLEDFIETDEKVWNPWLRQQRGFLRKTYQRYPNGHLDIRIFWASQRDWDKAARDPELPAIEVRFRSQFLGTYTSF